MDIFKKTNVIKATSYDFNAPKVVKIKNRNKLSKLLSRYSRRKLKQSINKKCN
jgi:hypothetical protein